MAATLTGGNRNDVTQLLPLVEGVGPIRGKPGWPRQRADSLTADRGYDHDEYRRELWARWVGSVKIGAARRGAAGWLVRLLIAVSSLMKAWLSG